MFDGSMQVETGAESIGGGRAAWRELDRQFRSLAKRRGALDHEELALIREAIAVQLWRELGMVSIREYLETAMGYTPGVASERVRVAEALEAMPALEEAHASGELSYSAVREITRIANRRTERAWLAACRGKTMKEISELLAEREPGDRPESPRKPDLRMKKKTLEYPPHVEAILRQCRAKLEREMGERVAEHEVLEAMGLAFLRGKGSATCKSAPTQIAIRCARRARSRGRTRAGVEIRDLARDVRAGRVRRALARGRRRARARAVQSITPALREYVLARDKHRCRVPGCRSAQNLEVHHLEHQEHGGSHDEQNLVTICGGHHGAHHDGTLILRGTSDALEVIRLDDEAVDTFHVESPGEKVNEVVVFQIDAVLALKTLGLREGRRSARCSRRARMRCARRSERLLGSRLRCGAGLDLIADAFQHRRDGRGEAAALGGHSATSLSATRATTIERGAWAARTSAELPMRAL